MNEGNARRPLLPERCIINHGNARRPLLPERGIINEGNAQRPLSAERCIINHGNARRPLLPRAVHNKSRKFTKTPFTRARFNKEIHIEPF